MPPRQASLSHSSLINSGTRSNCSGNWRHSVRGSIPMWMAPGTMVVMSGRKLIGSEPIWFDGCDERRGKPVDRRQSCVASEGSRSVMLLQSVYSTAFPHLGIPPSDIFPRLFPPFGHFPSPPMAFLQQWAGRCTGLPALKRKLGNWH